MAALSSSSEKSSEKGHFYVENDRRLIVETLRSINPPSDTTIFLIHGSMGSKVQFSYLVERLKVLPVNIVLYDYYGCGESDKPRVFDAYSTNKHLNDLIAVYEKYSTSKNILIGHSFGTSQIAKLCKHIENNSQDENSPNSLKSVDSVILLGSAYHVPDKGHPIFGLPVWVLSCISGYLSSQFAALAYSPKTSEKLKKESLDLSGKNDMYVVKAYYNQLTWAKHEDWASLTKYPTLLVHGEDDKILPLQGAEKLLDELKEIHSSKSSKTSSDLNLYSTAQLMKPLSFELIEECGHQIMIEKPDQLFTVVKQFLINNRVLPDSVAVNDVNEYWNNEDDVSINGLSSDDIKLIP